MFAAMENLNDVDIMRTWENYETDNKSFNHREFRLSKVETA
jgi:hypothetical protein